MIKAVLFDWGNVLRSKKTLRRSRDIYSLASQLYQHGVKTGILSNVWRIAAMVVYFLRDYRGFDPVILSYKVRVRKPDIKIYQIAVQKLDLEPKEVLFVDNLAANITAAKKFGMRTVLAQNSEQVVAEIKKMLLRENNLKL